MNSKVTAGSEPCGRRHCAKNIRAAAIASVVSLQCLLGSGVAFASGDLISREIADGRPWQMRTEDGRVTTLVLYANGTGKITGGPMNLLPKWRATIDGICLKPAALVKERCIVLSPTGKGFVGTRDGATVFTLER